MHVQIGIGIGYASNFLEEAQRAVELEKLGVEVISVEETYSFDAVSQLGYLAAITEKATLSSAILPFYSRTPTLMAMSAAGVDMLSGGRFRMGIGSSGGQVIEGWHGVPFNAPLGRTREIVEICRTVWMREPLQYDGTYYQVPLKEGGAGMGIPLRLINRPVRDRIPIYLASLTPKAVTQMAEIAEGWMPVLFAPEHYKKVWGESLDEGLAHRHPSLGPLQIQTPATFYIGPNVEQALEGTRKFVALYVGGMGSRKKNFYNDVLSAYGYEEEARKIQDLYLTGRKEEAAAAVPMEFLLDINLVGETEAEVGKRLDAFIAAGVSTIRTAAPSNDFAAQAEAVETLRGMLDAREG